MANGAISVTATSAAIVAADAYRDTLIIQHLSGDAFALGFNEAAVYATGLHLRSPGDTITVTGALAREAVYGICDTGNTATGGWQDGTPG